MHKKLVLDNLIEWLRGPVFWVYTRVDAESAGKTFKNIAKRMKA